MDKELRKRYGFAEPWIGVDLDGTLSQHPQEWMGYDWVGEPIPGMLRRVKRWIRQGRVVKIFTARAEVGPRAIKPIHQWCKKHGLPKLAVTNVKDSGLVEIWDDLAIGVRLNTGRTCCPYQKNWKFKIIYQGRKS